ncbi:hypothetical protein FGO68_gene1440 [Halteria grandinella]|uniref:Uncharacterized protein n=1 Tax=Halteria grandinella TaxID=5974 RepID=A0A8J8NZ89_HALGN|nr:hypothetical protein FGO68_gene1440 [Halteria grandinella]
MHPLSPLKTASGSSVGEKFSSGERHSNRVKFLLNSQMAWSVNQSIKITPDQVSTPKCTQSTNLKSKIGDLLLYNSSDTCLYCLPQRTIQSQAVESLTSQKDYIFFSQYAIKSELQGPKSLTSLKHECLVKVVLNLRQLLQGFMHSKSFTSLN